MGMKAKSVKIDETIQSYGESKNDDEESYEAPPDYLNPLDK